MAPTQLAGRDVLSPRFTLPKTNILQYFGMSLLSAPTIPPDGGGGILGEFSTEHRTVPLASVRPLMTNVTPAARVAGNRWTLPEASYRGVNVNLTP